jgi:hypothetical protein
MLLLPCSHGQSRLLCTFIVSATLSSRYICRGASRQAVGYLASSLACVATIGYVTVETRFRDADVPVSVALDTAENHRKVDSENTRQCL